MHHTALDLILANDVHWLSADQIPRYNRRSVAANSPPPLGVNTLASDTHLAATQRVQQG